MKTITVCLVFAGWVLTASGEVTQEKERPRKEQRRGHERGGDFAMLWKRIDVDQNGSISFEEFNAMPRIGQLPDDKRKSLFKRLDKDGDGELNRREMESMRRPPGGPGDDRKRLFALDKDRSGGISFEEFQSGELFRKLPPDRLNALFKRLDTDGDGEITHKDRPEPRRGQIPRRESADSKRGERPPFLVPDERGSIRRLDADGDGFISFDEFRQGPDVKHLNEDQQEDRFEALDKDGNLKLSPEEISKSQPPHRGGPKTPQRPRPHGPPPAEQGDDEMMDD